MQQEDPIELDETMDLPDDCDGREMMDIVFC